MNLLFLAQARKIPGNPKVEASRWDAFAILVQVAMSILQGDDNNGVWIQTNAKTHLVGM